MSHLSQIKTHINNTQILQRTLINLGFQYTMKKDSKKDMHIKAKDLDSFELLWNGEEYYVVTDLQIWEDHITTELLIDQITQQYSYNCIIEESIKRGFTNYSQELMQDGSIKVTVQRWI